MYHSTVIPSVNPSVTLVTRVQPPSLAAHPLLSVALNMLEQFLNHPLLRINLVEHIRTFTYKVQPYLIATPAEANTLASWAHPLAASDGTAVTLPTINNVVDADDRWAQFNPNTNTIGVNPNVSADAHVAYCLPGVGPAMRRGLSLPDRGSDWSALTASFCVLQFLKVFKATQPQWQKNSMYCLLFCKLLHEWGHYLFHHYARPNSPLAAKGTPIKRSGILRAESGVALEGFVFNAFTGGFGPSNSDWSA
jgi:hypothetical protein